MDTPFPLDSFVGMWHTTCMNVVLSLGLLVMSAYLWFVGDGLQAQFAAAWTGAWLVLACWEYTKR